MDMDVSARFARFPGESIRLCGESIEVDISQEIEDLLIEDVSYRTRQVAHVACQFMHHAKRNNLTTQDIDRALKWTNIEPVYGHSSSCVHDFQLVNDSTLYIVPDNEVRLIDMINEYPISNIDKLVTPLHVSVEGASLIQPLKGPTGLVRWLDFITFEKTAWLSIEGLSLLNEEGEPGVNNNNTVELNTGASEAQYGYLSLLMEGVSGDKEDIRQVALHDLQYSAAPANILPFLFQYIQETVTSWQRFTPLQLVRFLRMVIALFRNQSLFLDPYASNTLMLLHGIIMDTKYLHSYDMYTHWHVRELTACAIAEIIKKCNNRLTDYHNELLSSFTQVLASHQTLVLPVTFGIVFTLCYLGGKSISSSLLPVIAQMSSHIQEQLEFSSLSSQQDILRVYNTILIAAEILLISSEDLSQELRQYSAIFKQVLAPDAGNGDTDSLNTPDSNGNFTLYEFLIELFGERLILMLESRKRYPKSQQCPLNDHKKNDKYLTVDQLSSNLQVCIDEAFRRHQMREGFVSLHHLVSSQRLVTMKKPLSTRSMNCRPFCIRMYRLPIIHNVLELPVGSTTNRGGYQKSTMATDRVVKGKLKGKRRYFLTSNMYTTSVGSYWL